MFNLLKKLIFGYIVKSFNSGLDNNKKEPEKNKLWIILNTKIDSVLIGVFT